MSEANLVPATDKELDSADSMLASLTNIAYATKPLKKVKPKKRHKSRFFFRLSKSFADEMQTKQTAFKPKAMVHIDAEVERRLTKYKKEMPPELSGNIDVVREFFLKKIGPLTLATGAGATQAQEVVKRLLNSDVDPSQFDKFERMSQLAVNIKMARFIAKFYGLPKGSARKILDDLKPRPPAIIPIPTGGYNGKEKQKAKKADNA